MRRIFMLIIGATLVIALVQAGASMIDLSGSDTAPGSNKGDAACAGPLHIETPVSNGGHDNNQITHMTIAGNMTACMGETLLVEVDNDDGSGTHAYATYYIDNSSTTLIDLQFDAVTGDFYDTYPTASGGGLVDTGTLVAPMKAKYFGLYTITIASSWE